MKKTILIMDDDPDILDSLRLVLEEEGYKVITSVNGEYLENFSASGTSPDLIILDVFLSGNDGREITKKLKQETATSNIPILMISANPSVERSTINAGAKSFLSKPFSLDMLLSEVSRLLH